MGDVWAYTLAVLSGISCIKTGVANIGKLTKENEGNPRFIPIMKLEKEIGEDAYYVGDVINEYLFNSKYSVWNTFCNIFVNVNKHNIKDLPDVNIIVAKNSENMGKSGYKIWDNRHNPCDERLIAKETYETIKKHLEPFKVEDEYIPMMYGIALAQVVEMVAVSFPKHLNCYEMILEAMVCNAHMDYL